MVVMNDVDASQDLPGRLGVAVQMLAHAGRSAGGRGELTPTRLTALAVMNAAGPMRMGALAARLGIQVSTLSRIVDILVASGWAQRRPDEADHRACVIGITGAGTELIGSVRRSNETRLADSIARLGPEELAVLEAALPVLESLAGQATGRPVPVKSAGNATAPVTVATGA
jgi:DNA-binding MarR family transcriptional regulator